MNRTSAGRGVTFVTAALATIALAGCGDGVGPSTRFDPLETLDRVEEVIAPLEADRDFLLGLDLVVATLDYYGSDWLADAASLRPGRQQGLLGSIRSTGRLSVSSAGAGAMDHRAPSTPATSAFTLPDGFEGRTLSWDSREGYVFSGRSGAPARGARFILYRMDDQTGYPSSPLTTVGYIDITDDDGATVEAVRVRAVRTNGPSRVLADYRVAMSGSGSYDDGSMEVTTRGTIAGAGTVQLDLSQRLDWDRRQNRDLLRLDYRYDRSGRSVRLEGEAVGVFEAVEWSTFEFDLWLRGGADTRLVAEIRTDGSVRGEIREAGRRVVWIDGYDTQPVFRRDDGGVLTAMERSALAGVWTGVGDLIWFTDWIAGPADLLMLPG